MRRSPAVTPHVVKSGHMHNPRTTCDCNFSKIHARARVSRLASTKQSWKCSLSRDAPMRASLFTAAVTVLLIVWPEPWGTRRVVERRRQLGGGRRGQRQDRDHQQAEARSRLHHRSDCVCFVYTYTYTDQSNNMSSLSLCMTNYLQTKAQLYIYGYRFGANSSSV